MNAVQQTFLRVETKPDPGYRPTMIRELPASERPVNRLNSRGALVLSNSELLAAIIQTPIALHTANHLLAKYDGILGLARASTQELLDTDGLGPAKVAQIQAAFELGRRLLIASPQDRTQIRSPADAASMLMVEMMNLAQEHFLVICLNTKSYIIETRTLYVGSLSTTVIRIGEVFEPAIKNHAAAIIIAHNHPSGDPTPSPEDVQITTMITQAGQLLDIQVLDHLIIGYQRYVSLKERGLGFK